MAEERALRSVDLVKHLTRLDLYHHSLRLAGERLVLRAREVDIGSMEGLMERSVELAKDWFELVLPLREYLDDEDAVAWNSLVNRAQRAIDRASHSATATLQMVNIWRVVEAGDQFMSGIAPKYGYSRLSGDPDVDVADGDEFKSAELSRLFTEYENAMAVATAPADATVPPFVYGILRWRGSQLYYVERVEDGARWVELDPEHEPRIVGEELGGVEFAEAQTIEGYEIKLALDVDVGGEQVEAYLSSQAGHEYFVSGHQFVGEKHASSSRSNRGR